jgi:hypothetical protein
MYASTWGMAERMRRDDKEPVASFGEFVYDNGDLGTTRYFVGDFRNTGTQNVNATIFFTSIFLIENQMKVDGTDDPSRRRSRRPNLKALP